MFKGQQVFCLNKRSIFCARPKAIFPLDKQKIMLPKYKQYSLLHMCVQEQIATTYTGCNVPKLILFQLYLLYINKLSIGLTGFLWDCEVIEFILLNS